MRAIFVTIKFYKQLVCYQSLIKTHCTYVHSKNLTKLTSTYNYFTQFNNISMHLSIFNLHKKTFIKHVSVIFQSTKEPLVLPRSKVNDYHRSVNEYCVLNPTYFVLWASK